MSEVTREQRIAASRARDEVLVQRQVPERLAKLSQAVERIEKQLAEVLKRLAVLDGRGLS